MTPQEKTRLERVEKFIERLTLGSYLAKAAGTGGKVIGNRQTLEPAEQDLARSVTDDGDPLAALQRRVKQLEQLVRTLTANPAGQPNLVAQVDNGQQIVAKAAGPKRKRTKEEIEAQLYADLNAYVDSPTVTGQISSMIAAGQYKQVRQVLTNAKRAHESEKIAAERKRF